MDKESRCFSACVPLLKWRGLRGIFTKYRNLNGATTTRAVKVTHYIQKEGN